MLKIETEGIKINEDTGNTEELISINGIVEDELHFHTDNKIAGSVRNNETIKAITSHSPNELYEYIYGIEYYHIIDGWEDSAIINISYNEDIEDLEDIEDVADITLRIKLMLYYYLMDWVKPYSIIHFRDVFTRIYNLSNIDKKVVHLLDIHPAYDLAGIEYNLDYNSEFPIKLQIEEGLEILNTLTKKTVKHLLTTIDSDVVLSYFQFPEEYKTACKQYLIYFTQFIADIGIEVDTEIKEEANETLLKLFQKIKMKDWIKYGKHYIFI